MTKSPFYIVPEFLSPMMCEEVIELCDFNVPDTNIEGKNVKMMKTAESAEAIIYERLLLLLPEIQDYYQLTYKGTAPIEFEWYPTESEGVAHCENSRFLRGKWLRVEKRDLTGVLFLSDYQESEFFEQDYEVYGGKLEFPQHRFGFNPQRGTLVIFPSDPHFINVTSKVHVGDLFQARIQIDSTKPYFYNPQMFPGDYTQWF